MSTKECRKCGPQPASAFSPSSRGGLRSRCRRCTAQDQRERDRQRSAPAVDAAMAQFGTPIERACAETLMRAGSVAAAAAELELHPRVLRAHLSELQRRAAARGWSPAADMVKPVPEGFHVKGVSTYYRHHADGSVTPRGQWVKTRSDDQERYQQLLDAMATISDAWRGAAKPIRTPKGWLDDDLLAVYPMGDPHLGMYSWAEETGADFDLAIAERNLFSAVDHLVGLAPPSREALVVNLGDYFHADNKMGTTTAGTRLDNDTRWGKVLSVGIRTMRRCIDRALEKHAHVRVINVIGNHDDHTAVMLSVALSQFYEREPRVTIDVSPAKFHWYRFGKVLIGATHGDTVRFSELGAVMAVDQAEAWGQTLHRYFYCGHVHHDTVKELPGVTVETFRTLAPRDKWHTDKGYRSGQDMKLDILHREHGRIQRHTVGIRQIVARQVEAGEAP